MQLSDGNLRKLKAYRKAKQVWEDLVEAEVFDAEAAIKANTAFETAKTSLAIGICIEYGHFEGEGNG